MDDEQFQRIAKALADPRRREILERVAAACVAGGEAAHCTGLAEQMPIGQPTISHHVKELISAGLLTVTPSGGYNLLSVRTDTVAAYTEALNHRLGLTKKS